MQNKTYTQTDKTVADRVKAIIRERGLKQYCVAGAAGIDPKIFNYMLNGKKTIKTDHLVSLSKALKTDPNTLLGFPPQQQANVS